MLKFLCAAIFLGQGLGARALHPQPGLYGSIDILCGIDSLTAGAGGTSFVDTLAPRLMNEFGDGGPGWIPFSPNISGFKTNTGTAITPTSTLDPMQYSGPLVPSGVYWLKAISTDYVTQNVYRAWDYATVAYLIRPGGGSFSIQHSGNVVSPLISCSGPIALGFATVKSNRMSANSVLTITSPKGAVTIFGTYYRTLSGGIQVSESALGGLALTTIYGMNASFRRQWFEFLQPSVVILNAGTNDRKSATAAKFGAMLRSVISDIIYGSPLTQILVVEPNECSEYAQSYLPGYRAQIQAAVNLFSANCAFYSDRDLLGTFAQATADGYLLDTVHPNANGNAKRARALLARFGISPLGQTAAPSKF